LRSNGRAVVTPIIATLSAAAGVMVIGWFLVSGRRLLSRRRRRLDETVLDRGDVRDDWIYGDRVVSDRQARRVAAESPQMNEQISSRNHESDHSETADVTVPEEADELVARAERERRELLEKAWQEADAIVKEAELKAGEALIAVERARGRLEQELQEVAREKTLVAERQQKLSEFLLKALEEVERASADGSASIHDLAELRELRERLYSSE
jgi:cell division septum initiation protein DivIVA